MPTDVGQTNTFDTFQNTIKSLYTYGQSKGRVPGFDWADRVAHWTLRIPLAGLLFYYGSQKFPSVFVAPGDYGVPALLFIMAAFAEILGAIILIAGGLVETWRPVQTKWRFAGDVLTRGGGLAGMAAVLGVIAFFYWGALTIADLQVMALGLSAFFLLRGNYYGAKNRA
ncbi:MAG: hypothetical protein AAF922_16045 [Pseudomonadota bacterium]